MQDNLMYKDSVKEHQKQNENSDKDIVCNSSTK